MDICIGDLIRYRHTGKVYRILDSTPYNNFGTITIKVVVVEEGRDLGIGLVIDPRVDKGHWEFVDDDFTRWVGQVRKEAGVEP